VLAGLHMGIELRVMDLAGTLEALINDGYEETSWEDPLNDVGAGSMTIAKSDPFLATTIGQELLGAEAKIISTMVNGVERGRWIVEEIQESITNDEIPVYIFTGRGIASELEWGTVLPTTYNPPSNVTADTVDFTTTAAMDAYKQLWDAANARGATGILSLSFSDTVDSDSVSWADSQDLEVPGGGNLLSKIRDMATLASSDWHVDPDGTVDVRQTYGTDLSSSFRLAVGYTAAEMERRRTRRSIRNALYLEGKEGLISATTDATSITNYNRRETYIGAGEAMSSTTRDAYLAAALEIAKNEQTEWSVVLDDPTATGREPWVDFDLGDTLNVYSGEDNIDANVRVLSISISQGRNHDFATELTLESRLQTRNNQLARAMKTLTGLTDLVEPDIQYPVPVKLPEAVGEIDEDNIATGSVSETKLASNSVTTPKIATNAVTANEIAANTITASQVAANTITASEIAAGTLTSASGVFGTISANDINGGEISGVSLDINGNFTVTSLGVLTATGADIAGDITADSFATGTSGRRIEITSGALDDLRFYSDTGTNYGLVTSVAVQAGSLLLASNVTGNAYPQMSLLPATGDVNLIADWAAGGRVRVTGPITIEQAATLEGAATVDGTSTLKGAVTLQSTLTCGGTVDLNGYDLDIPNPGDITDVGFISVRNDIDFTGATNSITGTDIVLDASSDVIIDGAATVQIKDSGTEYARFTYTVDNVGRLALQSGGTTEGGELELERGSYGSQDAILDNFHSGDTYFRILGDTSVMARFRLDTAVYALNVTGRDMKVNSNQTIGCDTASTIRVKKNIQDMDLSALRDRARQLRITSFEYDKEKIEAISAEFGEEAYDRTFFGHIAEEVHEIFPEATKDWVNPDGTVDGYDNRTMISILWGLWQDADARLADAGL
jgi:hypothetical protein